MLTDNQRAALDHTRSISVTANAGAGKTTVLTRRFVEVLLKTETPVNQVVAITFTDKAANELRKKIADYVQDQINENPARRASARLVRLRDQLVSANIGTIHSFCAQLLREFPVEAGIDPSFTVLEGIDRQVFESETFRGAFESLTADDRKRESVAYIVRMLGRGAVVDYLKAFLQKREQVDRLIKKGILFAGNHSDAAVLDHWDGLLTRTVVHHLDTSGWKGFMEGILAGADNKKAKDAVSLMADWHLSLPAGDKIALYLNIHRAVFTKDGNLRKGLTGPAPDPPGFRSDIDGIKRHLDIITELLPGLDGECRRGNRVLLNALRIIFDIYNYIVRAYDEKKIESGYLDFDDILLRTSEILSHPDVKKGIENRFRFIMVDEFQDTSRLQYEIIDKLTSGQKKGNLFIVGDPKQSIYGFRDAEVEIFEEVSQNIAGLSGGRGVLLAESFRLLPNLIDFIDRIFSRTASSGEYGFDVPYNRLLQGRKNSEEGFVELLFAPSGPEASGDDCKNDGKTYLIAAECAMIAQRIRRLVADGHIVYSGKEEIGRPVRYRDIAVLLRGRTHLQVLEKVLTEHKIPLVQSGGVGFYQTREVCDLMNYLKFLFNPDDDVALAGILRSPFFTISDAELFEASLAEAGSFWDRFRIYSESRGDGSAPFRAASVLRRHIGIANRISIPLLVRNIFRDTAWSGTAAGLPGGEQRSANARKLLGIAAEFEERGYSTLYDFTQRLNMLAMYGEREGEASVDLSGNCVQVLTIHGAKGLEFPVVFIPFTDENLKYDDPPIIDAGSGIAFKVRDPENLDEEMVPSFYYYLRHRNRRKTEAEEKRVFYVGCTRARDGLILSGRWNARLKYTSYLGWIDSALGLKDYFFRNHGTDFQSGALRYLRRPSGGFDLVESGLCLNISSGAPSPDCDSVAEPTRPVGGALFFTDPIDRQAHNGYFSATQIKTYIECPRKFYLKYILGLPDDQALSFEFREESDADDVLRGEYEGLLTHSVLESVKTADVSRDAIMEKIFQKIRAGRLPDGYDERKVAELTFRNATAFIDSPFGREVLRSPEFRTEFQITSAFGSEFLTGTIDRLYRDNGGSWCIVDYKTDKISESEIERRAGVYKRQLLFYALLVNKFYRQKRIKASIFFLNLPFHPVHYEFSESDIRIFEKSLEKIILDIKLKKFEPLSPDCRYCDYRLSGSCPYRTEN